MAGSITDNFTITVPYSAEVKDGLLIIVRFHEAGGDTPIGTALRINSSRWRMSDTTLNTSTDLGIASVSYSNGTFTIICNASGIFSSYEVAFLQLNLD